MGEKPTPVDANQYLSRLSDREIPLQNDDPIFLPERCGHKVPEQESEEKSIEKKTWQPPAKDYEEEERIKNLFYSTAQLPASQRFSEFPDDFQSVVEVIPGKAWVFKLLTQKECEEIINKGEAYGIQAAVKPGGANLRTSKRTSQYVNSEMSATIGRKLGPQILDVLEATPPYTPVKCIHPNWRVARYEHGEQFPAHYDQSDMVIRSTKDGKKKLTSSHTLLIQLSCRSTFKGGATRFFVNGKYDEGAVDVELPQGYAVVFHQKGMLHAGLEVFDVPGHVSRKYIAQAGVLRGESKRLEAPSLFKYGPGLVYY